MIRLKKYLIAVLLAAIVIAAVHMSTLLYIKKAQQVVQGKIHQLEQLFPWIKINYDYIGARYNGDIVLTQMSMDNLKTGRVIKAKKLIIHRFDQNHAIPSSLDVDVESLAIPIIENKSAKDMTGLRQLGYKTLVVSAHIRYSHDDFARQFTLHNTLRFLNMGDMELKLQLANVDWEQLAYYQINPGEIVFLSAGLKYTEKALLHTYLAYTAQKEKLTEKQLMQQMDKTLEHKKAMAEKNEQTHIMALLESWQRFLARRKGLQISARKIDGISLQRLNALWYMDNGKEKLADALGLRMTVSE